MFMHLCCSLNRCIKMLNRHNNKSSSKHNPTQSRVYSCNDLPCLLSFDIFDFICILQNTLKFFLKYCKVLYIKHTPESHRLYEALDPFNELQF